jgi:pyrimidine operon attenuation protein/uracil phosphoribosyltransferase
MPDKKIIVLNKQQIQQKIDRMAYQVLEDNLDEDEIIIAGILPRGSFVAQRLKAVLDEIAPFKSKVISIDLDKDSSTLNASINVEVQECANKVIILVDDVLSSGKTLAYGLGVFLDVPLKKMRTLVLVDRNHKSFPIATDFTGLALSTVLKEHVEVVLNKTDEEDAVYLR